MIDPNIRRFRPGDTQALIDLDQRAMGAEGTDPEDIPGIDDLRQIDSEYIQPGGEFLVAVVAGRLVGMGGLKIDGSRGELFRMRVDPNFQRQGIGTKLLQRLETRAGERGVTRLVAETARRQGSATAFYPAHGFEEVSHRSFAEYELIEFEKPL